MTNGTQPTGGDLLETSSEFELSMGISKGYGAYSALMQGAAAYSTYQAAMSDYSALNFQALQEDIQAKQVGIQATERGNLLRQKVMTDIANAAASYSARGISISGGTPTTQAEASLVEAGEDVKTIERTARLQKITSKAQARLLRTRAKLQRRIGTISAARKGLTALSTISGSRTPSAGG